METKHAPGPWKVDEYCNVGTNIGYTAVVYDGSGAKLENQDRLKANAKLIAAAPDLLEALKTLLDCCLSEDENHDYTAIVDKAKVAIEKATK